MEKYIIMKGKVYPREGILEEKKKYKKIETTTPKEKT